MKKIKIFVIFIIILIFNSKANSQIEIRFKVGEEIITNIDVKNEMNYLVFLRPNLGKISENELIKISENSIIREIIKKKEIDRLFTKTVNIEFIDEIKNNLLKFKSVNNEEELKILLNNNNIEYEEIIEKMKYEGLWNELVFKKYNSFLKTDKKKLKEQLIKKKTNEKSYQYNLSELLFEISVDETFNNKYEIIKEFIKVNDFKTAAVKYSISDTSNKGGQIGWVKDTFLSEDLVELLSKIEIGRTSKPIKTPNGYLILKINNKKEIENIINIEKELDELIKYERNNQLNQFSLMYYKKLKQSTIINEY
ncbi:hypothetical protein AKH18_00010 [Pelagibacteraceae bacterium GOM-A4]|nr:hypothetical protein AKH18_00010 [Pelagibacteraceae bacterium GOM-A4]